MPFPITGCISRTANICLSSSFISIRSLVCFPVAHIYLCRTDEKAKQAAIRYGLNSQISLFVLLPAHASPQTQLLPDKTAPAFAQLSVHLHVQHACVSVHPPLCTPLCAFFSSVNSWLLEQNNCHFPASGSKVIQHNEMYKKEGEMADRRHAKSNVERSE